MVNFLRFVKRYAAARCMQRRIFTARRYASAVYAIWACVCPSVSVCQVGVLQKRLNVGSYKVAVFSVTARQHIISYSVP